MEAVGEALVDALVEVLTEEIDLDDRAVGEDAEAEADVLECACAAPFSAEHPAAARQAASRHASATPVRGIAPRP